MAYFFGKMSGCVVIGVRSVCVEFCGYAAWLGCKNRVAIQVKKADYGRGNYQKRNIL